MDAGKAKSRDFRLSQVLANQVVRKGVCGNFILCALSPPVSADWSLVHRYTFGPPLRAPSLWCVICCLLGRDEGLDPRVGLPHGNADRPETGIVSTPRTIGFLSDFDQLQRNNSRINNLAGT
jgi:hypothetical protein